MRIMKQRERSLVRASDLLDAHPPLAIGTHQHCLVVETRYDPFEVVPVECIEITPEEWVFRSHKVSLLLKLDHLPAALVCQLLTLESPRILPHNRRDCYCTQRTAQHVCQ